MATVTMPQLGESVTEGTILRWLKQPGDAVALDDPLCEIETEKVTAELPSPFEGTMGEQLVPEGETIEVGAALCEVAEGASSDGQVARAAPSAPPGSWRGGPMSEPPEDKPDAVPPGTPAGRADGQTEALRPVGVAPGRGQREPGTRFYSPVAMRLADEHGVDLAAITGTGLGGRVTRKDVEAHIAGAGDRTAQPAAPSTPAAAVPDLATSAAAYEVVALTPTRRTIAEHMRKSNVDAPQAWTMVEADVTALARRREEEREALSREAGADVTLLAYFVAATCEALREHPALNARWGDEELRRYRSLDIGIAVSSATGLVVPVIHDAGSLSVAGIAKAIADLASRARTRALRLEDIEGGTFTVNNTGAFGSIASKPIVNTPQVAIVTMERVVRRPVVVEGDAIAIRAMVNVCLAFDHRALDGHEAGAFLAALKSRLEAG